VSSENWAGKLENGLRKHLGDEVADNIMTGSEILESNDCRSQAEWMKQAMSKLDRAIDNEQTKIKILTPCSCSCFEEHIEHFKRVWAESGDIDQLLDEMHGRVFGVKPVREGNVLYIQKMPRFPEEHANAKTPEEKKFYFCHCDYARSASEISKTYCYCGAGWCKRIWEEVLGRKVRVDITHSVLQNDDYCRFAVHL
jgi:hypothetical protein